MERKHVKQDQQQKEEVQLIGKGLETETPTEAGAGSPKE